MKCRFPISTLCAGSVGYDADDMGAPPVGEFWRPTLDSKQAFARGTQSADIVAEQEKLLWADTVIFQFSPCGGSRCPPS